MIKDFQIPHKLSTLIKFEKLMFDSYEKGMLILDDFFSFISRPSFTGRLLVSAFDSLEGVVEVKTHYHNRIHEVRIFIEDGNMGAEDEIYSQYGDMLSEMPDANFEVRVVYLLGRDADSVNRLM